MDNAPGRAEVISAAQLRLMTEAAVKAADCIRVLSKSGQNLVGEVLRCDEFTEWEHYPPDDVHDSETHAHYYFHAHAPDETRDGDFGHFHTFLMQDGFPDHLRPAVHSDSASPAGVSCHLIAISMTPQGLPERLFTTNRWVTGETWYAARDVIAMLDRFDIDLASPSWPLNQWLSAMLVLFRPQIEQLILQRDQAIECWRARHPERDVFEDRELEVTSSMAISLVGQIEWLDSLGSPDP
ncbi:hypothetical protein FNL55_02610 [Tardiphaga sp. vice352]|uniref:DUF6969 family protein n=1 Tax=unclassified Tardiphaga TaxID=2631404 RepID=UPI0011655065|nr:MULTISPECIES: hypothetical protein [unclassified Tardiphaga]QDM14963.1 hypothetical protein FNL53_02605 [Tardiphaga sp. vice278]QDM20072.1 hypothetical protein FIU28_02075 [Tardiphaga sp. vice154]QDM25143.1 hypothetical protein FNL56_02515 [Tardiphaga sp. vice304]QDM30355.1 hypothetical protein FNL55_02610 [Tardiphaga sp. vice352]